MSQDGMYTLYLVILEISISLNCKCTDNIFNAHKESTSNAVNIIIDAYAMFMSFRMFSYTVTMS